MNKSMSKESNAVSEGFGIKEGDNYIIDPRPYTQEEKRMILEASMNKSEAINPFDFRVLAE